MRKGKQTGTVAGWSPLPVWIDGRGGYIHTDLAIARMCQVIGEAGQAMVDAEVGRKAARRLLHKQSKPACMYLADNGCGDGGVGHYVAYLTAICNIAKELYINIVEYNI